MPLTNSYIHLATDSVITLLLVVLKANSQRNTCSFKGQQSTQPLHYGSLRPNKTLWGLRLNAVDHEVFLHCDVMQHVTYVSGELLFRNFHCRKVIPEYMLTVLLPWRWKQQTSPQNLCAHLTSPHLTLPHLTLPHLTSPHLTSLHLTWKDSRPSGHRYSFAVLIVRVCNADCDVFVTPALVCECALHLKRYFPFSRKQ